MNTVIYSNDTWPISLLSTPFQPQPQITDNYYLIPLNLNGDLKAINLLVRTFSAKRVSQIGLL